MVTGLNPRACQEATNASTHWAWNAHGSVVTGSCGTAPPRARVVVTPPPHTFLTVEGSRWRQTYVAYAWKIKERAGRRRLQARARILHHEHVPAPDRWTKTFTDPRLCAAIVDRLLHHAHLCVTRGDSVRLSQATSGKGVVPLT
jgi:hypothetical protein